MNKSCSAEGLMANISLPVKNCCLPFIFNSKLVTLHSTTPPVSGGSPFMDCPGIFTFFNFTFEKSSVDCSAAFASFASATFRPFKNKKLKIRQVAFINTGEEVTAKTVENV